MRQGRAGPSSALGGGGSCPEQGPVGGGGTGAITVDRVLQQCDGRGGRREVGGSENLERPRTWGARRRSGYPEGAPRRGRAGLGAPAATQEVEAGYFSGAPGGPRWRFA